MYLKGVNRGLSFTKPGVYTLGLVMLLGLLATGSGYNGFFLALGFGLSLLVISGILSEKIMKSYQFLEINPVIADANETFHCTLQVYNQSRTTTVLGIDNLIFSSFPKFKLFSSKFQPLFWNKVARLEPLQKRLVTATCKGMDRGHYTSAVLIQQTLFPFGLINKFKVEKLTTDIRVLPKLNTSLFNDVKEILARSAYSPTVQEEFLFHRPYQTSDSHKLVDWKKSANLSQAQWVTKVFQTASHDLPILIKTSPVRLAETENEGEYENLLSRVRTVVEVCAALGKVILLQTGLSSCVNNRENALHWLSELPRFADRKKNQFEYGENIPSGKMLRIEVSNQSILTLDEK